MTMERPTREYALELMSSKDKLEEDLKQHLAVLEVNNVGMSEALVDQEGYPRSDIDVYQVRIARNRIICLRNDLKSLTQQIEEVLLNLHSQQREGLGLQSSRPSILDEFGDTSIPFAKIGTVTEGSPADKAGLRAEDVILGFGSLRSSNFTDLQDIAKIVQHSVGREIPLCIRRSTRLFPLTLVPKAWDGRGLLGCVLLPYDTLDR